jgi:response regulator of citrate/malate metabolism
VRRAWRGGVVHYLMKPFTYDALRERLEHYAQAHQGLRVGTTAEQADVDRMFGVRPTADDARLPKGLSPQTRRLVAAQLKAAGTLSAAECAAEVGISRVSARRYLEYLAGRGSAEVSLRYGTTGRPERRYTWRG